MLLQGCCCYEDANLKQGLLQGCNKNTFYSPANKCLVTMLIHPCNKVVIFIWEDKIIETTKVMLIISREIKLVIDTSCTSGLTLDWHKAFILVFKIVLCQLWLIFFSSLIRHHFFTPQLAGKACSILWLFWSTCMYIHILYKLCFVRTQLSIHYIQSTWIGEALATTPIGPIVKILCLVR